MGGDNNVYGELMWHSVFLFSCEFTSLARGGEGITCTEVTHFLSHITTAYSRRQMSEFPLRFQWFYDSHSMITIELN